MIDLAQAMRTARVAAGMTQDQVADYIRESAASLRTRGRSVQRWESGETIPDLVRFREWCVATGASADEVLGLRPRRPGEPAGPADFPEKPQTI